MMATTNWRSRLGAWVGGFGVPGGFDATSGQRRLKGFVTSRALVNALIAASGPEMNARARWLVRNNGYAANAIESWAANTVGDGISPNSSIEQASRKDAVHHPAAHNLVALMRAEVAAGQKAVSVTMAEAGAGLKSSWRGQITGAGLGQRLANTIRSQTYPKGRNSLDAAALVWSNAPVIIGAHDTGPLIRSGSGFWLAIPLPAAGKALGGKRIMPGMWEQRTGLRLRFVYRSRGPSLLVADAVRLNTRGQAAVSKSKTGRGQVTAPVFLLVRQVKLPKRLDLARDAERAQAAIPGSIVRNWVEDHL